MCGLGPVDFAMDVQIEAGGQTSLIYNAAMEKFRCRIEEGRYKGPWRGGGMLDIGALPRLG